MFKPFPGKKTVVAIQVKVLSLAKKGGGGLLAWLLCLFFLLPGCDRIAGLQEIRKMEIGQAAPDFTLQDVAGRTWKLSSLKGKVVNLDQWEKALKIRSSGLFGMHRIIPV